MEININITIDDRIVNSWKRGKKQLPKLLVWLGLIPIALHATPVPTLTSFTAGTAISASQMNANFTAVKTAVDDNDARITTLENSKFIRSANGTTVYAFNDNAGGSSIPLTTINQFNYGNPINITRNSAGDYRVTFTGLNCDKGMFIANASVNNPIEQLLCRMTSWSTSASDCNADVICFISNMSSSKTDSTFTILYID